MLNLKKAKAGFTLIEVIAAAALLGLLVTMAMPALSGANARVKDARLKADLATVDQAISLYLIDNGSVPKALKDLRPNYISGNEDIVDATNKPLGYEAKGTSGYVLKGVDAGGETVTSKGSYTEPPKEEGADGGN